MSQIRQDACIISRETASVKDKDLKRRLFGTAAYAAPTQGNLPKTYAENMADAKLKRSVAETKESTKLF